MSIKRMDLFSCFILGFIEDRNEIKQENKRNGCDSNAEGGELPFTFIYLYYCTYERKLRIN